MKTERIPFQSSSFSSSKFWIRFTTTRTTTRTIAAAWILAFAVMLTGCSRQSANEVVIYCSVDQMHAEPILKDFEKQTGIRVKAVYDSEAVKTVGLVNRIRAEAKHPQADVFWNNEFARTFQLFGEGVVDVPSMFAARIRVLVYNTNLVKADEAPQSIFDLSHAKWRGKVAMAYPLFGTTATHAATLFAALGEETAKSYYQALKDNEVKFLEGNSVACEQVARGHCLIGITDTDDFWERKAKGATIAMVYPDQSEPLIQYVNVESNNPAGKGRVAALPSLPLGCCVIPNTIALVRRSPHPDNAQKLVKYVFSREVEQMLAFGPSRQIPMLGDDIPVPEGVRKFSELKPMMVDATSVAELMPVAAEFLKGLFIR